MRFEKRFYLNVSTQTSTGYCLPKYSFIWTSVWYIIKRKKSIYKLVFFLCLELSEYQATNVNSIILFRVGVIFNSLSHSEQTNEQTNKQRNERTNE